MTDETCIHCGRSPNDCERSECMHIPLRRSRRASQASAQPQAPTNAQILANADRLFPRWREDIQERFVLLNARAALALASQPPVQQKGEGLTDAMKDIFAIAHSAPSLRDDELRPMLAKIRQLCVEARSEGACDPSCLAAGGGTADDDCALTLGRCAREVLRDAIENVRPIVERERANEVGLGFASTPHSAAPGAQAATIGHIKHSERDSLATLTQVIRAAQLSGPDAFGLTASDFDSKPDVRIYWHASQGWQVEWLTAPPNGGASNYYSRAALQQPVSGK